MSFLILILLVGVCFISAAAAQTLFVWPKPRSLEWGEDPSSIPISSSFNITLPKGSPRELHEAASRCRHTVLTEKWLPVESFTLSSSTNSSSDTLLVLLSIEVSNPSADLQHGVDESYTLIVGPKLGKISAITIWGAMRGLETFSQLIIRGSYHQNSSFLGVQRAVKIVDSPLYPHRGLLLDTSRNFYPVKHILRTIRAMSYNKLNVFHWHITDSHSFPLFISSEPELSNKGSYGQGLTYSDKDVKKIIRYARSYGVRVIPEIDIPGHAASWGEAYPEIVTCLNKFWWDANKQPWSLRFASEPATGQLDPLNPKTYKVVENVINDVASRFTDTFYHAGGDEISGNCWKSNQDIAKFIEGGNSMNHLLENFINKTYPMIRAHNKTVIYWEDVLLNSQLNISSNILPKETSIIQTWNNGVINTKLVTAAGYRAIVSSSDFLYLDCGHGDFLLNDTRYDQANSTVTPPSLAVTGDDKKFNYGGSGGSWCAPFKTWQRIYSFDLTLGLTVEEAALVVGAEVALWSEQSDGEVVDERLWPRSAALSEITWSGTSHQSEQVEVGRRLGEWRERMVRRGIGCDAILPRWCLRHLNMCNLNV